MCQIKNTVRKKECTSKQLREKVEEMQVLNMKHDNQLRGQMRSVLMNLEIEQAATKDASLEIERLNVQLDVSKESCYELEARFNQDTAVWTIKEDNYLGGGLQLNETAEREINELLVNSKCDVSKSNTSSIHYNLHSKPCIAVLLEKIRNLLMANNNLRSRLKTSHKRWR
uniref:Uncharacterized protein n=1 Tax=Trichobilharzia regenti TaxID=157069 RepID=A0AA85JHD2_TRIRE|nr:unnamed protein product [Trichobilharzia regenti]